MLQVCHHVTTLHTSICLDSFTPHVSRLTSHVLLSHFVTTPAPRPLVRPCLFFPTRCIKVTVNQLNFWVEHVCFILESLLSGYSVILLSHSPRSTRRSYPPPSTPNNVDIALIFLPDFCRSFSRFLVFPSYLSIVGTMPSHGQNKRVSLPILRVPHSFKRTVFPPFTGSLCFLKSVCSCEALTRGTRTAENVSAWMNILWKRPDIYPIVYFIVFNTILFDG